MSARQAPRAQFNAASVQARVGRTTVKCYRAAPAIGVKTAQHVCSPVAGMQHARERRPTVQ